MRLRDSLLAWFAVNPDEELTSNDVVARWGVTLDQTRDTASMLASQGILTKEVRAEPASKAGRLTYLSAGPELLRELGK